MRKPVDTQSGPYSAPVTKEEPQRQSGDDQARTEQVHRMPSAVGELHADPGKRHKSDEISKFSGQHTRLHCYECGSKLRHFGDARSTHLHHYSTTIP